MSSTELLAPLYVQLFSIVILGCVANEGYINQPEDSEEFCIFNHNQNACNYAISMGTLCFLCSTGFLALDIYFPQISGVKDRKKAVMADVAVSGETPPSCASTVFTCSSVSVPPMVSAALWSLVWFVGFCFLAHQWQVSKQEDNPLEEGADAARAAIVFCFFSVFTWVRTSTALPDRISRCLTCIPLCLQYRQQQDQQ